MKHPFLVGQRVQLNHLGRGRMPRLRGSHVGTVVKIWDHSATVRVLLDGHVTPLGVHYRYLEKALKFRTKTDDG